MRLIKNSSGYYRVAFRADDGKVHSISTRCKNKEDAQRVAEDAKIAELEYAAEIGILSPQAAAIICTGKKMTIEDAVEPWKEYMQMRRRSPRTIEEGESWVRAWSTGMGIKTRPLKMIEEKSIDAWINSTESKSKLATRLVMLAHLRSFFKFCHAKGWTSGNPAALVEVDQSLLLHIQKETTKKPVFTEDEVNTLLDLTSPSGRRPDPFWHAAIAIGRWTGLRLCDICSLEWECLSVPGKIIVWTQKRDRRVELAIEPEQLATALMQVPKVFESIFMFPVQRSMLSDGGRASLSSKFIWLCETCGIVGKSFHGFRATFINDWNARGIPIEHISTAVGHTNPWTTRGYLRPGSQPVFTIPNPPSPVGDDGPSI